MIEMLFRLKIEILNKKKCFKNMFIKGHTSQQIILNHKNSKFNISFNHSKLYKILEYNVNCNTCGMFINVTVSYSQLIK